jgi:hypothetical protein
MLKALNCPPKEWAAEDVRKAAVRPGWADVLITWAPWGFAHPETQDADWAASDQSVEWAHSTGKPVVVCLPTQSAPPSLVEWEKWVAQVAERYSKCTLILTNEPMNWGMLSAAQVAEMTRAGAEVAREAGHRRIGVAATDQEAQALAVIKALKGWQPPKGLRAIYCHHHYNDVTYHDGRLIETEAILKALVRQSWSDGELWLSEGGYRFTTIADKECQTASYAANPICYSYARLPEQESAQRRNLCAHYESCKRRHVGLWANYEVRDWLWGGWASGLIRAFAGGPDGKPSGEHPVAARWGHL